MVTGSAPVSVSKRVEELRVDHPRAKDVFIPLGIVEGRQPGPTLAIVGGVHGTEYAAQEAVSRVFAKIDPAELSGTLLAVLMADVAAFRQRSMYVNPLDGTNLNRAFPGVRDKGLTEATAATLFERVIRPADAVIDLHGGELIEDLVPFVICPQVGEQAIDQRSREVAHAYGLPYVELTDATGAVLGVGTLSAEAARAGKPAITPEAGGQGHMDERSVQLHANGVSNVLKLLGMLGGSVSYLEGEPRQFKSGIIIKSIVAGVFQPAVRCGESISKGALFGTVRNWAGQVVEEVVSPDDGMVIFLNTSRSIAANGFAGKIGIL